MICLRLIFKIIVVSRIRLCTPVDEFHWLINYITICFMFKVCSWFVVLPFATFDHTCTHISSTQALFKIVYFKILFASFIYHFKMSNISFCVLIKKKKDNWFVCLIAVLVYYFSVKNSLQSMVMQATRVTYSWKSTTPSELASRSLNILSMLVGSLDFCSP